MLYFVLRSLMKLFSILQRLRWDHSGACCWTWTNSCLSMRSFSRLQLRKVSCLTCIVDRLALSRNNISASVEGHKSEKDLGPNLLKWKALNNLFLVANHYTIERFCYSKGKMIRSLFILSSSTHFLTWLANSINLIFQIILHCAGRQMINNFMACEDLSSFGKGGTNIFSFYFLNS